MNHCRLCGVDAPLMHSHILPAFVFRWLRESSGNGHLRSSIEPNQRVQDGLKRYWLCAGCEENFSQSERAFANGIFYPYLEKSGGRFPYGPWLLHFCGSVSWRVLKLAIEENHLEKWDQSLVRHAIAAESTWREFLLGRVSHPGNYRQHILPLDQISGTSMALASNINRYLMRAVHTDLCHNSSTCFTYAKLGRFIILGTIFESNPGSWKGTKIQSNEGIVEPRQYVLPRAFGEYLNEKAREAGAALEGVSPRQQSKIDQAFRGNVDRYVGSDAFMAMQADVAMFGDAAFRSDNKEHHE